MAKKISQWGVAGGNVYINFLQRPSYFGATFLKKKLTHITLGFCSNRWLTEVNIVAF
jgi:hypothetical protein